MRKCSWVTFDRKKCRKINRIIKAYEKLGLIEDYRRSKMKFCNQTQYNFIWEATIENSEYLTDEIARTVYAM